MQAVAKKHNTNELGGSDSTAGRADSKESADSKRLPILKIRFAFKAIAFIASVISLSWFFEGWRKINEAATVMHIGILIGGTLLTLALICLQAYWIYIEEKTKGTLKKRIGVFDKIETYLESLASQKGER